MNPILQAIYDLFKPMKETVVWSDGKSFVSVAWALVPGHMEWFMADDRVCFRWVPNE